MAMTFIEKISRFISINSFHVNRVHTLNSCFSMQDSIVFDSGYIERLVIPEGMHIETDYSDEAPNVMHHFIVDNASGDYEELIDSRVFWNTYAEELKLDKALSG